MIFESLKYYCMFIGYPRSGHTLYGCLLDAHPNIVIAQEAHALQYFSQTEILNRRQFFNLLIRNSKDHAAMGKVWQGYAYVIPNWFQGKYELKSLQVIGDKQGGASVTFLQRSGFGILKRLEELVKVPIRYVHVIRNPFDNISTISIRQFNGDSERSISYYNGLVRTVSEFRKKFTKDIFEVKHEDFISQPIKHLADLCDFLEVEYTPEYLEACSKIVFKNPKITRNLISWSRKNINRINRLCKKVDFLRGYSYG